MKRYTAKKAGRICEKVLSAARSVGGEKTLPLHNAWTDAAGRTYVCDGYRAYRLNAAPEGMTVTWSVHIWSDAIKARVNQVREGVQRMFKLPDTGDADGYTLSEMPAPDYNTVAAAARFPYYNPNVRYDCGDDFPVVNAKYLRDALDLLPGAKWYCVNGPQRMVSPVYAVSDNGTAVILPIRDERKFYWGR